MCESRRLPLHMFGWRRDMGRTGLRRDTVYLVRPDGYIATVDRDGHVEALTSYLESRQITLSSGDDRSRCI
jgi:hypothetical protein